MRKDKAPTFTSLVEDFMRRSDDFVAIWQIMASHPELTNNRVTASLAMLRKFKAVDFMESEGMTYWYCTPDTDTRSRTVEERAREEPGTRKTRRTK